jgi:uncharacterized membrane protein HdeD (DUF308 family)
MLSNLTRNWWLVGLRGLLAIVFGVMAFVWPGITLQALVFLFGFYAIFDGVLTIGYATTVGSLGGRWGWMLFEGILGVIAGIIAFVWPDTTALALLFIIAAYAFAIGCMEIAAAVQFNREINQAWLLGLTGVMSIVFSVLLVVWPGSGLLSLVWLIGLYSILYGITLLVLGYHLNQLKGHLTTSGHTV